MGQEILDVLCPQELLQPRTKVSFAVAGLKPLLLLHPFVLVCPLFLGLFWCRWEWGTGRCGSSLVVAAVSLAPVCVSC